MCFGYCPTNCSKSCPRDTFIGVSLGHMPEFMRAGRKFWSTSSAEGGSWPACTVRRSKAVSQFMCVASAVSVVVLDDDEVEYWRECDADNDAVVVGRWTCSGDVAWFRCEGPMVATADADATDIWALSCGLVTDGGAEFSVTAPVEGVACSC